MSLDSWKNNHKTFIELTPVRWLFFSFKNWCDFFAVKTFFSDDSTLKTEWKLMPKWSYNNNSVVKFQSLSFPLFLVLKAGNINIVADTCWAGKFKEKKRGMFFKTSGSLWHFFDGYLRRLLSTLSNHRHHRPSQYVPCDNPGKVSPQLKHSSIFSTLIRFMEVF